MLFSTGGAAIKANALSGLEVAGLRAAIATVTLVLLVPKALRAIRWQTLGIGALYACTTLLFATSNKLTTAASTIFLQSTAPLFVLVLAPWVLKEPIERRDLAWMTLTALGLGAIVLGADEPGATAPNPALGNILAAAAGLTWAFSIVGLRWLERNPDETTIKGRSAAAAVIAGNFMAALFCLPALIHLPPLTRTDLLSVSFLGVFQIGLAYFFLTRSMGRVRALDAVLLLLIEPVLSPLWAWLCHGEIPGWPTGLGGALILASTVGRSWRRR